MLSEPLDSLFLSPLAPQGRGLIGVLAVRRIDVSISAEAWTNRRESQADEDWSDVVQGPVHTRHRSWLNSSQGLDAIVQQEGRPALELIDVVCRQRVPEPWAEGEKIPWDAPAFSRRMLDVHLAPEHDAASRRFKIIDRHVEWIHHHVLKGTPTRILDLGCGPGLYTSRLAELGHYCVGIDFSPASIAYAREHAEVEEIECRYAQHDIRTADYGDGYGLVMLIFGEINVFRPGDAKAILEKAYRALLPDGLLLLEPHTFEAVFRIGKLSRSWYSAESGLFSEAPHLCLQESFWEEEHNVAIQRYYVIDAATGEVERYSSSTQAYTDEEYRSLLADCGFCEVILSSSLDGSACRPKDDMMVALAHKRGA